MRSFWKWLATRAAKYAGIPLRDPALVAMLGGAPTAAGVDVDERTALNLASVWQAVNIIASNVAAMPPVPYHITRRGREIADDHWSYDLLLVSPNDEMTPFTCWETLQAHALTWGNGYAYLDRNQYDEVEDIRILLPSQTTPQRDGKSGRIQYKFTASFPGETDEIYDAEDVLHLYGMSFDGLKGYPVVQQARESIGLSMGAEKYGAAFYGRGSTPGGILEIPVELEMTEKAKSNLRESFEQLHRGPDNAHRVAVLENGIKYHGTGLPLETAQFLQTRSFQVIEVARWFNIPPHMLRDLSHATFSNIEHQGIEFLTYTLRPWLLRWQQEFRRKLYLNPAERRAMEVEHDTSNLLLADITARYSAYKTGREGGWVTLNDIMRREKRNPILGPMGDARMVPANHRSVNDDGHDVLKAEERYDRTALNGQQVESLHKILLSVAAGQLNGTTAAAAITAAFPSVPNDTVHAMIDSIKGGSYVPEDGGTPA